MRRRRSVPSGAALRFMETAAALLLGMSMGTVMGRTCGGDPFAEGVPCVEEVQYTADTGAEGYAGAFNEDFPRIRRRGRRIPSSLLRVSGDERADLRDPGALLLPW